MSQQTPGTKIGVATATIIGMNAMIGSGIFTDPGCFSSQCWPRRHFGFYFCDVRGLVYGSIPCARCRTLS